MINDQPQLTNRLYPGKSPKRYVMCRENSQLDGTYYNPLPNDLPAAMHLLYEQRIQSVIVEGGRKTLDAFIAAGLWDEARILVGAQRWGKGTLAPALPCAPEQVQNIDDNQILYVRRHL
jgi:diaminohydroxyphosphoribosylaminopyrimidine deaminase/5-amino-6-(5-phosphoribosylamino)uracil reductase